MNRLQYIKVAIATFLFVSIPMGRNVPSALALPGQRPDQVIDWIRTNPALRPTPQERLLVRKSDTPARRFQFQASIVAPGLTRISSDSNLIRSEQISFFDIVNGVSRSRLEEALRAIYDPEIMQDYAKAKVVYSYPTSAMVQRSMGRNASPILRTLQGELRLGTKYGYWLELLQNDKGRANSGQITIFELEHLPKLEKELRDRERNF
ncbi:MAG: hypothetical protein NW214_13650 [Pseudanabaenaceae cyanobacterium bins.39]|nr:hypothetical protein [Pseudanabaenaceae cyanobacterium bins.39]